jgi:hypothetical protein
VHICVHINMNTLYAYLYTNIYTNFYHYIDIKKLYKKVMVMFLCVFYHVLSPTFCIFIN